MEPLYWLGICLSNHYLALYKEGLKMKLKIDTIGMSIIPESPQDEIYLESMFGLEKHGYQIIGHRKNTSGTSSWYGIVFDKQHRKTNTSDTTCMPCECVTETM